MDQSSASEISFREVRKLVEDAFPQDSALLGAVDNLLGAVLVLSPVVFGPAALPALSLLGVKNELVKLGSAVIEKLASRTTSGFLEKHRQMAAVHCLITYTAFFEALEDELPSFMKSLGLTSRERAALTREALQSRAVPVDTGAEAAGDLAAVVVRLPHPLVGSAGESEWRMHLYTEMGRGFHRFLGGLAVWDSVGGAGRADIEKAIQTLPERANEAFEARYYLLAVEHEEFFVWANLHEHEQVRKLAVKLSEEALHRIALVEEASRRVDLGLTRLQAAIEAGPAVDPGERAGAVWSGLHDMHAACIGRPIIQDTFVGGEDEVPLTYPRKADIFVPQAFKAIRYVGTSLHLEDENVWTAIPAQSDLGPFLVRYLNSPYSTETPLLVLGHPGSGKSLLTEMIAARLAPPHFSVVRVELRDINPEADLQSQIEEQIRKDTGRDVNWADLASQLRHNPPLVILDGYDELLQASGQVFSSYLSQVRRFQWREAVHDRPIRVIVTSRITLIDKAAVPDGSTVLRLLEFDEPRQQRWVHVWNAHNTSYFDRSHVRPFLVPDLPKVSILAEQPLLLLMLALYDSQGNQLGGGAGLDQTLLYHSLLTRFIEREHLKGEYGDVFAALPVAEREAQVNADLERLGVAAVGMFNRRQLHIHREQLDRDIAYFGVQREVPSVTGPRLTQADLLLGSFFFIHESRTRAADPRLDRSEGPAAFEFLHNTFGEFLVADFLLQQLLRETRTVGALRMTEDLRSALEQRLNVLTDRWFATLMYTPLHTRPVILALMREWLPHRLEFAGTRWDELLDDLDQVIRAQLRMVLLGSSPPPVMQRQQETPFDPLPLLGHLGVYSLNLIVLRTVLAPEDYAFDERLVEALEGGPRPWDQLSHLWRSCLSLESLLGLSAVLTSRRVEQVVHLRPRPTFAVPASGSRLDVVVSVGEALADDLLVGLAGLHAYDVLPAAGIDLDDVAARLEAAGIDLSDALSVRRWVEDPRRLLQERSLLSRLLGPGLGQDMGNIRTLALEVVDRVTTTPELTVHCSGFVTPGDLTRVLRLQGYEASVLVPLLARLEPRWLGDVLIKLLSAWRHDVGDPSQFAASAAAAPILTAATRQMPSTHVGEFASHLARAVDRGWPLDDPEALVQLAILGFEARVPQLRASAVGQLMSMLEDPSYVTHSLSMDSINWLVDLVLGHGKEAARHGMAALIDRAVRNYEPTYQPPLKLLIQRARVGDRERFRWDDTLTRDETLLLVRLARERGEAGIFIGMAESALSDESLWPQSPRDLTLREFDDLRWLAKHVGDQDRPPGLTRLIRGVSGRH